MTSTDALHKPEVKKLLSGAGLTILASSIAQPAFSQSLPPLIEDGTAYQIIPQLPIITNQDVLKPATGNPERFPNEFGRKSAVTRTTISNDGRFKLIRRLSTVSRYYRIPSPEDTDRTKIQGGRVIGAVELVEVLDTETGKKFEAAIPLCSIRKGKLAYPEPESYPSICGSAISNQ